MRATGKGYDGEYPPDRKQPAGCCCEEMKPGCSNGIGIDRVQGHSTNCVSRFGRPALIPIPPALPSQSPVSRIGTNGHAVEAF